jgi:hypothetical protein
MFVELGMLMLMLCACVRSYEARSYAAVPFMDALQVWEAKCR